MEHTTTITLREGVLNDDIIIVADDGYVINKRYKYAVHYWTFASAWCNHEHVFYAHKYENAIKRYERLCGKLPKERKDEIIDCLAYLSLKNY